MKRTLTLIVLMVGVVIVMSSAASAALDQEVIGVLAVVAPYAEITVTSQPMLLGHLPGRGSE